MQALKALVIFMAVLIVAGMVLLVYGLITRTGGGDEQQAQVPAGTAPTGTPTATSTAAATLHDAPENVRRAVPAGITGRRHDDLIARQRLGGLGRRPRSGNDSADQWNG